MAGGGAVMWAGRAWLGLAILASLAARESKGVETSALRAASRDRSSRHRQLHCCTFIVILHPDWAAVALHTVSINIG